MSTVAQTKTKKAIATKSKAVTKSKGVAHPPFADIIKECIIDTGDRTGVSRITIKKFAEEKYKLQPTPTVISNINRSIAYGAEKGIFVLPKGPSGKVKLAPKKSSSDAAKENAKPGKATASVKTVKKAATKVATLKSAKPIKKATAVTKKTSKPAGPAKKTSAKRSPSKKSITGTAKPKPAVKAKAPAKRTSATKRKSSSPAKPASKAAPKPSSKK